MIVSAPSTLAHGADLWAMQGMRYPAKGERRSKVDGNRRAITALSHIV